MNKANAYFCHFEYAATGEGSIQSFGFFWAENEKEAKAKLCHATVCQGRGDECVNFFKIGVDCILAENENWERIRDFLKSYLSHKMSIILEENVKDGGQIDFFFHSYFNYS